MQMPVAVERKASMKQQDATTNVLKSTFHLGKVNRWIASSFIILETIFQKNSIKNLHEIQDYGFRFSFIFLQNPKLIWWQSADLQVMILSIFILSMGHIINVLRSRGNQFNAADVNCWNQLVKER